MAATDKNYRDQYALDVVFALSSIAMLVSLVWMFVQDYNREFRTEQRSFRDVEAALFERLALDNLPDAEEVARAEAAVERERNRREAEKVAKESGSLMTKVREELKPALEAAQAKVKELKENAKAAEKAAAEKELADARMRFEQAERDIAYLEERLRLIPEVPDARKKIAELIPKKERSEQEYNDVKAQLESEVSLYNIEVEHNGATSQGAMERFKKITELTKKVDAAANKKDQIMADLKKEQAKVDAYEGPLTEAVTNLKKLTDRFDTQVRLAITKQWSAADAFRSLPVIEAFAPPIKIHQFTINDVPIDFNFKHVTRFDRCMSCHQGIDRPAFTKDRLTDLTLKTSKYHNKLVEAWNMMYERRKKLDGLPEKNTYPRWDELQLTTVDKSELTDARINEYCAHPRLDLFVGANSKHPAEKFGCTSCHAGQGSSTSFTLASHTPNNAPAKDRWVDQHGWESIHMWDFPMLPMRFIESSCLKCHHQVTDLYSSNNRNDAPKLLRGFNLIKENGCFGCHEIAGQKAGKQIGPDMRLEPTPPLEDLTPSERARIEADAENPPGHMRKVGPSLARLSEKTNKDWTVKWLRSPRGFRPDTKMPHFYGLSNNHADILKATAPDQQNFPDAEMWAVTHYLFEASNGYLKTIADMQAPSKDDKDYAAKLAARLAVDQQDRLIVESLVAKGKITDADKRELDDARQRIRLREAVVLKDLAPGYEGDAKQGRLLFTERGCLACHSHNATGTAQGKSKDKDYGPAVMSEANFGPNLSQITAKLGVKEGDKTSARVWLVQWLLNPQVHSPRSRMPVTHLTPNQAADIAAWLLQQAPTDLGADWGTPNLEVKQPEVSELRKLAEVYLTRILSRVDMDNLLTNGGLRAEVLKDLGADEREFVRMYKPNDENSLKHYLGKKAIGRLGCYACHDIPGFEAAKSIGVGLNDWGKKDPERLAFEDIAAYLEKHFYAVPKLVNEDGKPMPRKAGKLPYEKFFADPLLHHHHDRTSYLHQKVLDPRSYDYNRIRAWDDRSRMPEFRFARAKRLKGESNADYEARAWKEEAEAREAVMTFILGLVADPIPTASINQPKGDRLAEVKGRQVLDKYNCAGCHLVRPGVFEFKTTSGAIASLDRSAEQTKKNAVKAGDHYFPYHSDWAGKLPPPPGDKLLAHGVRPEVKADEGDANQKNVQLRLTRALRFAAPDKSVKDIQAASTISVPLSAFVYPPPSAFRNEETLHAFLADKGAYGGQFADLLVDYLVDKDKGKQEKFFVRDNEDPGSDASKARPAVPPILLGQGERTQTEWLYRFLLDPQPVRKMTVLRMPRFNMSKEEARALVDYFSAVERSENPGVGLSYPYETIAQQEDVQEGFWLAKNAEYVARLEKDGLLKQRVEELAPIWQEVLRDNEARHKKAKEQFELARPIFEAAQKAEQEEKDPVKKKSLEEKRKEVERVYDGWKNEEDRLARAVKASSLTEQEKTWRTEQAYVADAFKLLVNKQLCLQCHQVGDMLNNNQIQGPPLHLAHARLRPGWLQRWVATPQRFLTYASSMPNNFPVDKKGQYKELFAGEPLEQATAVRDLLMNYPRAAAMPANHYWVLPLPKDQAKDKTGDKK